MISTFDQQQRDELTTLKKISDDEIDTTDIPEAPAGNWADARRPQQPGVTSVKPVATTQPDND